MILWLRTESGWECPSCGNIVRGYGVPLKCQCNIALAMGMRICSIEPPCPMSVVVRLTRHGVNRLQRCRASNCGLMHIVDGTMRCVGMRGSKCQWISNWAACLNGETPFPNGEPDCPHWE